MWRRPSRVHVDSSRIRLGMVVVWLCCLQLWARDPCANNGSYDLTSGLILPAACALRFHVVGTSIPSVFIRLLEGSKFQGGVSVTFALMPTAPTVAVVHNETADIGVVDLALPAATLDAHPLLMQVPMFATAVVPCVNLPTLGDGDELVLSRATLAAIYLGHVRWWNDSAIAATNPLLAAAGKLPPAPITAFALSVRGWYARAAG